MHRFRTAASLLGLALIACLATGCLGGLVRIGPGIGSSSGPGGQAAVIGGLPEHPQIVIPETDDKLPPHVPGELLVGLHPGADVDAIAAAIGAEVVPSPLELIGAARLRLDGHNRSLTDALRKLQTLDGVRYSQPNYTGYTLPYLEDRPEPIYSGGPDGYAPFFVPNDPAYTTYQYGPQKIQAPAVWDHGFTGAGIVVAVVDTGVDSTHPDLLGGVLPGYNPDPNYPTAADYLGHGTHVAGIIAASTHNGIGIAGVAPGALILPVRVFNGFGPDGQPVASDYHVAVGILFAANPGYFGAPPYLQADVINLSLGSPTYSQTAIDAVNYALDRGIVVVAASGNEGFRSVTFPALYPGVIAVASTDPQDRRSHFSTSGDFVSVAAPGSSIWSTFPPALTGGAAYRKLSGTSMATPHVSGTVALMLEANPNLTPAAVKEILEETADPGPGFERVPNPELGWGRINALRAVQRARERPGGMPLHTGEITVTVVDPNFTPIVFADVTLYRGSRPLANLRTGNFLITPFGSPGAATFRDLEPGDDYSVTVQLSMDIHGRDALITRYGIQVQNGQRTDVLIVI